MTGHFLHSVSIMNVGKMKKMRKWIFIILMAVLLPTCQKPKIEIVDFDTFHVTSVKQSDVIVDGAMNPEIRTMELGNEGNAKNASISLAGLVENLLTTMQSNKVLEIAGTYTGHDIDESPITLSGKVMLPAKGKIKKMIIVSHWTIGANRECPSESFQLEGILASKGYAVGEINTMLNAKKVSDVMTEVGCDKHNPQTAELYRALMKNSILFFTPRAPVYFFHSMDDNTVPFVNALKAEEYFKGNNIIYDFDHYGNHQAGAVKFILNVYNSI